MVKGLRSGLQVALTVTTSFILCGCGIVDGFGDRATRYNVEAENTRSQTVLLNIVRAAYRKPTQFGDMSTVTGTGGVSGGLSSVAPLGGLLSSYQINPSLTFSGGPSFTVGTTNTKEFYSALLAQIPTRQIAIYIQQGRPRKFLLTMLLSRVSIKADGVALSIPNDFRSAEAHRKFQSILDDLVDAGLTVKTQRTFNPIGPVLPESAVRSAEALVNVTDKGLELRRIQAGKGTVTYQLGKADVDYVFCFDTVLRRATSKINPQLALDRSCDRPAGPDTHASRTELDLFIRSTDGVIAFLGEIARKELSMEAGVQPFYPMLAFSGSGQPLQNDILFHIRRGAGERSLSVDYQNLTYSVQSDPSNVDHSGEVVKLVEELVALNSSAKDLPAPNAITLIGR